MIISALEYRQNNENSPINNILLCTVLLKFKILQIIIFNASGCLKIVKQSHQIVKNYIRKTVN